MVEAAVNVSSHPFFVGLVEGFAALGALVAFTSSLLAFVSVVLGKTGEEIADAVNYGIAFGFAPGMLLGGYIFVHAGVTL